MHIADTLNSVKDFLEEHTKDMRLLKKDTGEGPPTVYKHFLPPKVNTRHKQDEDEDFYPFILVRYLNSEHELHDPNIANFRVAIGIYCSDEQEGPDHVINVIDRITFKLKTLQNVGSATLYGKIEAAVFEVQKKPMFHGIIDFSLKLPQTYWERSPLDDY